MEYKTPEWTVNVIKGKNEDSEVQDYIMRPDTGYINENFWTDFTEELENLTLLPYLNELEFLEVPYGNYNDTIVSNELTSLSTQINIDTQDIDSTHTLETPDETILIQWEPDDIFHQIPWYSYNICCLNITTNK